MWDTAVMAMISLSAIGFAAADGEMRRVRWIQAMRRCILRMNDVIRYERLPLASREKAKNGIRVQDAEDNTFFIQSKVLLDGICMVVPQIGTQSSCLLHGKLLKEQNVVAFDLNDIEMAEEADERGTHETGLAD